MNLIFFDIETYRDFFCFCGILYDSKTHEEKERFGIHSDERGLIGPAEFSRIEEFMEKGDYVISYNGSRFDIPVLAKMRSDIRKMGQTTTKYVYSDAEAIIGYDDNNHPVTKRFFNIKEWSAKHFDLLNNCLLGKSLKQWEMYCNLPIRELPYPPDAELTEDMKKEIYEYCFHDVWATSEVYWRFGSGEKKSKYYTLPSRIEVMKMWPSTLPFRFDRTTQAVSAGIIYQTNAPIPPKSFDPLELFKLDDFEVPQEMKDMIKLIARTPAPTTAKGKRELAEATCYKGIQLGKGGCHYIVPGHHKKIFCFDVQSEYPRIIRHWNLLKTPDALERWSSTMEQRFAMKNKKGTPEYHPDVDAALKVVLNSLSGGFRIRSGGSVAFDPAVGEAMCYIGQLLICELALACPDWNTVIEINTDSVFVVGEENAAALRIKCEQMRQKYDMLFEEEVMESAYFRDVNNYAVFDSEGNLVNGKGLDYSDMDNKNHEKAVIKELFRHLTADKLDLDWTKYDWTDFIFKYHRSAASKYAMIGDKPMDHKNYYFLWTTRECPDAQCITFSNELMDSRNGSLKPRYGVFAFDIKDLEPYKCFIDFKQYHRDLDENLYLWGRGDLVTTFMGNAKERKAKGIKVKTLIDALKLMYPWSEPVDGA